MTNQPMKNKWKPAIYAIMTDILVCSLHKAMA